MRNNNMYIINALENIETSKLQACIDCVHHKLDNENKHICVHTQPIAAFYSMVDGRLNSVLCDKVRQAQFTNVDTILEKKYRDCAWFEQLDQPF